MPEPPRGRFAPPAAPSTVGGRLYALAMPLPALELDLEVFQGPFDLLLALVLREEVDLLELDLAEVVIAYLDHLERTGQLDLESTTEFLVLIAALLELKSRLMLPREEDDEVLELTAPEAADELLARMLEYARYRAAAGHLRGRLEAEAGYRYRSAPLPPELRRAALAEARAVYEPERLTRALGDLLRTPPALDTAHIARPAVSLERRLAHVRALLAGRGRVSFDDCVADADRMTEAVTLFALLELYKAGEAAWEQPKAFGPIEIRRTERSPA